MNVLKNLVLWIVVFFGFSINVLAKEVTLFNSDGEAAAYIDTEDEDLTIYL